MEEIRIRKAGIGDLASILHHRRALFEEMGEPAALLDRMEQLSSDYFSEALVAGTYQAWLGETASGQIAGGAGVVVDAAPGVPGEERAQRVYIRNLYIEPAFRRAGVATRIMEAMIEWCRAEGFGFVSLHATKLGRPLYEALGFKPTTELRLKLRPRARG